MSIKDVLNSGDTSKIGPAMRSAQIGTLLAGENGLRLVRETVAVASNACTPTYAVKRLLSCKVSAGSTGNGEKECVANGDTGARVVSETLNVATAAATPTFAIDQLLRCKTVGTGAAGAKSALINGATPSAGQAAPNSAGTSLTFHAETTGTGTALVSYLTAGGCAAPNAGGTSVAFLASEVSGSDAVAELLYLTADPPKDSSGVTSSALTATVPGIG